MISFTGKKKINVVFLLVLLSCLTIQVYGYSDGLGMGKADKVSGKVTIGSEEIISDTILYGSMYEAINVGDKSALEIILPPEFAFGNDYDGIIELESNTEIIPNIYTTDSEDKEWWRAEDFEKIKGKTIIYIIDFNKGKGNIKMSYNCMNYIDIFQLLCGDYDAVENPRGGIIVEPYASMDVEFSIETQGDKLILTVIAGEVKVFNRIDIDERISAGQTVEFDL